jgi:cardiolipin synthase
VDGELVRERAPFGRGRLRRLIGLDRTAPAPTATRPGAPLHPLTIPNLVGYLRLAGIPVFLYLALDSGDGRTPAAALLFVAIALGDYVDGFLARATGQYSRMGALLDPIVDRLTILSGAVVCWHFELLPRWALAVLVARELATLVLAQLALRRGMELEVNWLGRWAVWPVMAAIFFAMCFGGWFPTTLLLVGLVTALLATALYVRMGLRDLRQPPAATQPPAHSS